MSTKSITSNSQRTTLCHATRYLAALMLLSCSQLSNAGRPAEGETPSYAGLQKRLESGEYAAVMAVDAYGAIKLLDPQGNELQPCGRVSVHGRIVNDETLPQEEQCNLQDLELSSVQTIQLFMIKKNEKLSCIVEQIGNYLYVVHSGQDKYPAGAQPCHVGLH
jgi:hypothetical protein